MGQGERRNPPPHHPLFSEGWGSPSYRETQTWGKIHMKMESFILWRAVLIFLTLPSFQGAESQPQSAVFLPEFALSPQGSFMEDATEDQFLTYRYDDQVSPTLLTVAGGNMALQKLMLIF
ncbi:hypothetical protein PFLUV_G00028170 [Perca fluviatilis]|uniref:Uncharacterized protein n=1 Tax=Perca fluviatilis TaxID=8168 RepID=A0A6A5FN74_PERFL|nr:hypothetical protein PFLUV_G00028170 [Perca fluviatilis]